MKVILIQNVPQLGQRYDVKNVSPGYARNYLIPQNMVKPATKRNMNWLESRRESVEQQKEKQRTEAQNIATMLQDKKIEIPTRVGEKGQLFENINTQKIAQKLQEEGFDIEKTQVQLSSPIQELEKKEVTIKILGDIDATIQIWVIKKEE